MGRWEQAIDNLLSCLYGPLHLRLLLQPALALFLAFVLRQNVVYRSPIGRHLANFETRRILIKTPETPLGPE